MDFEKGILNKFDKVLFFLVLTILALGFMVLYSASSKYHSQNVVFRQIIWAGVGLFFFLLTIRIDYKKIIHASYLLYVFNVILLLAVLFIGRTKGGAHRWITIGSFNLQPSELAKIVMILTLSSYLGSHKTDIHRLGVFISAFGLVLPMFFLILIEPDLGTALLFIPVAIAMLFMAGAQIKHLAGVVLMGIGAMPVFWHFLKDYQKQRLFVFINPNMDPLGSGYTIIQSKIAVGSGGLLGKGWLSGTQNQLNFLPERHTDFIFSVVGEEWGFLGAIFLILLYFLIVYRSIKIIEATPDVYGKLAATGIISLFSLQVIINIGMTIGFLPIVGLTLPLISYGGSSLITTFIYIGLLINIGMRRPLF